MTNYYINFYTDEITGVEATTIHLSEEDAVEELVDGIYDGKWPVFGEGKEDVTYKHTMYVGKFGFFGPSVFTDSLYRRAESIVDGSINERSDYLYEQWREDKSLGLV